MRGRCAVCIFSRAGLTRWQPRTDSWDVRPRPWLPYQLHTATVISTSSLPQWLMIVLICSFQTIWSVDTGKIFFGRHDERTQPKQLQSIFALEREDRVISYTSVLSNCDVTWIIIWRDLAWLSLTRLEKSAFMHHNLCMCVCVCVANYPGYKYKSPIRHRVFGWLLHHPNWFQMVPQISLLGTAPSHSLCVREKPQGRANKGGKKDEWQFRSKYG